MFYNLVLIFNAALCFLSIRIWLIVISRSKKKIYLPVEVRKLQLRKQMILLSISCFLSGFVINAFFKGCSTDPYKIITGTVMYIALYVCSLQFLHLSREKEIIIKDGLDIHSVVI